MLSIFNQKLLTNEPVRCNLWSTAGRRILAAREGPMFVKKSLNLLTIDCGLLIVLPVLSLIDMGQLLECLEEMTDLIKVHACFNAELTEVS